MFRLACMMIVLTFVCVLSYAQPIKPVVKKQVKNSSKWEISLGYSMGNASLYHDKEGNKITKKVDTIPPGAYENPDTIFAKYTFQYTNYTIVPSVSYKATEYLKLSASLPFTMSFMEEKYTYDTAYARTIRNDYSHYIFDYLALGIDYKLLKGTFEIDMLGGLKVPFGTQDGQGNTDSVFLCDNAFEYFAGTKLTYNSQKSRLHAGLVFNGRSEDFSSRFIFNGGLDFLTVKDTELKVKFVYLLPIDDINSTPEFNTLRRPLNEELFQTGVGFKIYFENDMFAEVGYNINLHGKDTWGLGMFNANLGIRF